ncbi:uncharacterized protein LOC119766450 [Culex quinquefasciatus]|uniref:uncharacterized protein LOC119766450 n=1 Tax=Culex quinquefasciatus TaxID=7176 RepID=UPI0018E3917A|nr:uncharacterized protein LOC119766450 [Culex quinquefasciatus]
MPPKIVPSTSKATLKQLQTKLKSLQSSFNIIEKFKNEFKEDTTANEITVRLERFDELWERIVECSSEVECHDDYVAVEDHVRLPQIKLRTFDGNIDEWFSFRDLYSSLIHWKQELPEVEKFHYLKGCLEGEARSLIEPIKITTRNYQVAWDLLLKRYNNSKLLKRRQVQALFKLPVLTKESVTDLHRTLDSFQRTVQSLDQIVQPADYRNLLLVEILSSRLDPYTRRGWEEYTSTQENDTLVNLTDFIQRRISVLESLPPKLSTGTSEIDNTKVSGVFESHYLHTCPTFTKMPISNRESLIRSHSLCRNCLRSGHLAKKCQSKYSCWKCKGRHHTMLCFHAEGAATQNQTGKRVSSDGSGPSTAKPTETSSNSANTDSVSSNAATGQSSSILLATAVVLVEDNEGNTVTARALLDSGSECNFIAERLYQRLNVSMQKVDVSVVGIGQAAMKSKRSIQAVVKSRTSPYNQEMSFLVLPKVTVNLPTVSINTTNWKIPDNVELADPTFFHSRVVDLVLGIQHFFNFFQTGKAIPLGNELPRLTDSVFGWVVSEKCRHHVA